MKGLAKLKMLEEVKDKNKKDGIKDLAEGIKGKALQKVTVAAPNKEGLEKGLSLAQELMKKRFGDDEDEYPSMNKEKGLEETIDQIDDVVDHYTKKNKKKDK